MAKKCKNKLPYKARNTMGEMVNIPCGTELIAEQQELMATRILLCEECEDKECMQKDDGGEK